MQEETISNRPGEGVCGALGGGSGEGCPSFSSVDGACGNANDKETAKRGQAPTAQEKARRLQRIWSRRMALVGLKRIYRAALEGARTEIRDEDGALIEVKFNPTAAGAATKAIEVANKMLGYTTPEEEDEGTDTALRIELLDAEAFAE